MSRSTNVETANKTVPTEATETRKDRKGNVSAFRMPDGVLYTWNKDNKVVPVMFSISAGISEKFSSAIDDELESYNAALPNNDNHGEDVTRAEYIRILIADDIGYDLTQEPVKEQKGAGLAEYRERQNQKVAGFDKVAALVNSDPDLAAKLSALGIDFSTLAAGSNGS